MTRPAPDVLTRLRDRIAAIERSGRVARIAGGATTMPLGVAEIDAALPEGGLAVNALHEIFGADGSGSILGADGASLGFCAVLLARLMAGGRPALWCVNSGAHARTGLVGDPYGPGLAMFGLDPASLILARARRDAEVLWAMEEGLRAPALAAVVGEVTKIGLIESRRLQLAAEASGVTALLLRPRPERLAPTAAVTRWRLGSASSLSGMLDDRGIGYPCWHAELLRCRGGKPRDWVLVWRGRAQGLKVLSDGSAAEGRLAPPRGADAGTG